MIAHARARRWHDAGLATWLVLFLAMVVLKSMGAIATPWWVVLAPLWGPLALMVAYRMILIALMALLLVLLIFRPIVVIRLGR